MIIKQLKNGSCDIEFSWRERLILFRKGKLHLSDEALKHFGNVLMYILCDWQQNFKEETAKKTTFPNSKIEGK
jgi:hypothetical protein